MTVWRMAFRAGKNGPSLWPDCQRLGVAAIEYGPADDLDFTRLDDQKTLSVEELRSLLDDGVHIEDAQRMDRTGGHGLG